MEKVKRVKSKPKTKIVSLPMDANFFFERAVRSLDRLHYDKALKYFRRAIELDPGDAVNYCNLAGVYAEMGNYKESNLILSEVLEEVDATMTECHFYMANNYANLEQFEQAEKALLNYLELDPDGHYLEEVEEMVELIGYELERPIAIKHIKSREGLFEHDRARRLLEEGRFAESVRILQRLIRKYPDFMAARNNLALAHYYMGQFEQAVETIGQVLELDPGNLHGLCNLAIFYQHHGAKEELAKLMAVLRKTYPLQPDHSFKLATTLGILGDHESAYRLFSQLLRSNYANLDACLNHYTAVAAYNTGRYAAARKYWRQAERVDPESDIPRFHLSQLSRDHAGQASLPLSYHYHLPFEEQLRTLEKTKGALPDYVKRDPLIRSSFFWALRHGDVETKLQVIQAFSLIADSEVEAALRDFLLRPQEDDYLKRLALFVLRSMGMTEPLDIVLKGQAETLPAAPYSPQLPAWEEVWQQVLDMARDNMVQRYDVVQQYDLETLWVEYLTRVYPATPAIGKIEGWAAALEYLIAKMHRRSLSYDEVARIYGVSISTIGKNVRKIDEACRLKEKMAALFPQFSRFVKEEQGDRDPQE